MRTGDLVLTTMQRRGLYRRGGRTCAFRGISSVPLQSPPRRPLVQPGRTIRRRTSCAPVPALLQSQAYVVDLTEAYEQLASTSPPDWYEPPPPLPTAPT